MKKTNINIGTTGLQGTILFCVLLVLKVTHVVNWSWWVVFAPFWVPFAILGVFLLFVVICGLLGIVFTKK